MTMPQVGSRAELFAAFRDQINREAARHDAQIRILSSLDDFAQVERGGESRIFDPARQSGLPLCLLVMQGNEVVATWACSVFDTGNETMADFLRHSNFYRDDGKDGWIFSGAALELAEEMRGIIAYCGGLWVREDHRGNKGGTLGPWWTGTAGVLGRCIAAEMWDPDWFWLISDFGKVADKCAPRYSLKQRAKAVDWLVDGQSFDGLKVLGVQNRSHLIQSVQGRLVPSHQLSAVRL